MVQYFDDMIIFCETNKGNNEHIDMELSRFQNKMIELANSMFLLKKEVELFWKFVDRSENRAVQRGFEVIRQCKNSK